MTRSQKQVGSIFVEEKSEVASMLLSRNTEMQIIEAKSILV